MAPASISIATVHPDDVRITDPDVDVEVIVNDTSNLRNALNDGALLNGSGAVSEKSRDTAADSSGPIHLSVSPETLAQALSRLHTTLASRVALPILSHVLIETTATTLRLTATDLDTTVCIAIPAEVSRIGRFTLPLKKLLELSKTLPSEPVTIVAHPHTGRARLACGRSVFRLYTQPHEEFPLPPSETSVLLGRCSADDLQTVIMHTAFAASLDDRRPILQGILCQFRPRTLRMVATDAYRLACIDRQLSSESPLIEACDLIVPAAALKQVYNIFPPDEQLTMLRTDNHVVFQSATQTVISRLIEGPYPAYESIIMSHADYIVTIDRSIFADILKRVITIAPEKSHCTRLSFTRHLLTVSIQTPDGGEARDEMDVPWDADPLDIGVNTQYLLDILRHLASPMIRFKYTAEGRPIIIEPAEWPADMGGLFMLVPMHLDVATR